MNYETGGRKKQTGAETEKQIRRDEDNGKQTNRDKRTDMGADNRIVWVVYGMADLGW